MRKSFFLLLAVVFTIVSCDDGDIITIDLEFDQELSLCGDENSENYVIYVIKNNPDESLTLLFRSNETTDLIFNPVDTPHSGTLTINNSSVKFNYRTYNGDPAGLICAEIPSSSVSIINDYEATNGTVNYTSTYIDDAGIRTVAVEFTIENLDLDILNSTEETLGTYTTTITL